MITFIFLSIILAILVILAIWFSFKIEEPSLLILILIPLMIWIVTTEEYVLYTKISKESCSILCNDAAGECMVRLNTKDKSGSDIYITSNYKGVSHLKNKNTIDSLDVRIKENIFGRILKLEVIIEDSSTIELEKL